LVQERLCITVYDSDGDGYLTEQEMEKYLTDLIPGFPQLQTLEKDFTSFYLCGAVRKFFFFLDPQRKGRISITSILISPILSEFFELQQVDLAPNLLLSNWFSMYSALKVYNQYVDLDTDRNGMLSLAELSRFAKSRYSDVFIKRVFQECQTYGGEMVCLFYSCLLT
jgi:Ca2+-binding EF-hand superfamily protein